MMNTGPASRYRNSPHTAHGIPLSSDPNHAVCPIPDRASGRLQLSNHRYGCAAQSSGGDVCGSMPSPPGDATGSGSVSPPSFATSPVRAISGSLGLGLLTEHASRRAATPSPAARTRSTRTSPPPDRARYRRAACACCLSPSGARDTTTAPPPCNQGPRRGGSRHPRTAPHTRIPRPDARRKSWSSPSAPVRHWVTEGERCQIFDALGPVTELDSQSRVEHHPALGCAADGVEVGLGDLRILPERQREAQASSRSGLAVERCRAAEAVHQDGDAGAASISSMAPACRLRAPA